MTLRHTCETDLAHDWVPRAACYALCKSVAHESYRTVAVLGNSPHYLYIRSDAQASHRLANKKARQTVPEGLPAGLDG